MLKICINFVIIAKSLTLTNFTNMRTLNVTSYTGIFGGCLSLTSIELPNFKTRNIDKMFNCSQNLKYIDLQSINCHQSNKDYGNILGDGFPNNGTIIINNNCISSIQNTFSIWSIIIS